MRNIRVFVLGGVGNQLFTYAFGKAMSLRHKARLHLDSSIIAHRDVYSRRCRLGDLGISEPIEQSRIRGSAIYAKICTRMPSATRVEEEGGRFRGDLLEHGVQLRTAYLGYWQDERYFRDYASEIRSSINLKMSVGRHARKLIGDIESTESVCVHVRSYGEVASSCGKRIALPQRYYQEALSHFCKALSEPVFYFFSDRPGDVKAMVPRGAHAVVVSGGAGNDELIDLELMRRCKYHILANSTFGWWGAWLSESSLVLYPEENNLLHYCQPAAGWKVVAW